MSDGPPFPERNDEKYPELIFFIELAMFYMAFYEVIMPVINIQLFEGRDKVKADIAKAITELLSEKAGVEAKYVYIIFNDVKRKIGQ